MAVLAGFCAGGLASHASADKFSVIYGIPNPGGLGSELLFPRLLSGPDGALYGLIFIEDTEKGNEHPTHSEAFKLTPPGAGKTTWTYSTIYHFDNDKYALDYGPAGLVMDSHGALYAPYSGGTYATGAFSGGGFIVKLTPPANGVGQWTNTLVHQFNGSDAAPPAFIYTSSDNTLYGTDGSEVYRLTPPKLGQSSWNYSVLYKPAAGAAPVRLLQFVQANDGSLLGGDVSLSPLVTESSSEPEQPTRR